MDRAYRRLGPVDFHGHLPRRLLPHHLVPRTHVRRRHGRHRPRHAHHSLYHRPRQSHFCLHPRPQRRFRDRGHDQLSRQQCHQYDPGPRPPRNLLEPRPFCRQKICRQKTAKSSKPAKGASTREVHRLSLLLTLVAVLFFTGTAWILGSDGKIDFNDGLVLVALFLFWQCFHVFEVLQTNARQNRSFGWLFPFYFLLLAAGGWAIYVSTDWLVTWVSLRSKGFVSEQHLGWLSGW